jgi:hypothetical protein
MDGDNPSPDCLRWPNGKDPWVGDANYWGDIQLASDIGTVAEVVTTSVRPRAAAASALSRAAASAEYFTLKGERVRGPAAGVSATGNVLLARQASGQAARLLSIGR